MFRLEQQPRAAVDPEKCGKTAALIRLHKGKATRQLHLRYNTEIDLEEVHPLPRTVQILYPVSNEDPYLVELHLTPDEGTFPQLSRFIQLSRYLCWWLLQISAPIQAFLPDRASQSSLPTKSSHSESQ